MTKKRSKEIHDLSKDAKEKKLKELKLELIKAKSNSAKGGSAKIHEIKKAVARIHTFNTLNSKQELKKKS
ncbi:50S ribosomal protein L29 [Candidatus Pacearchaeota archaeon CG10_big_fil_rev_8_21_14_0_10_32_14]|nr:MAG: 50S ribosomal protein L29 [Candidatus Pacearchaeota archaeon CG10_big_fil_rev_8_21_14_0_10_32_14]